jgi:TM2 domain-containing membrane protein YozV
MAILLSLICPGLGHLYTGRMIQGLLLFVLTVAGYFCFIVPGIIIHLFVIVDAARDSNRKKGRDMQTQANMLADAINKRR